MNTPSYRNSIAHLVAAAAVWSVLALSVCGQEMSALYASGEPGLWQTSEPNAVDSIDEASVLASATDDPNWISAAVKPVSHSANSMRNMLAAPKGIQVGSITVVPYGILWNNMIYSTSRTFPGHFILWIESNETQGEPSFVLDARSSRVGANILGPEVDVFGGMTGGGRVEIDFFGGFTIPNTTDVRLRHVYWEAKNDDLRLLVGQTWDVVSPLLPSTVNFSVSWATGNIGFRRAVSA